ncbi:hypothetical protein C900_05554 [Fulvivirga imtechensis AK7]|uniref:histidine kinase n=1 Tax=Fulvivirga imtechensis AK7 TaxID=1237149 RepID=L8JJB5_9BACT|nr:ATP-binding protein [Fulvivirga imtechensis]ELR68996.1 hypothetical protein C900_05554 [Fulvivirga imtechensis AK7]
MKNKKHGESTNDTEKARLLALKRYQALALQPEHDLENLAEMALYICHAPICSISLVDLDDIQYLITRGHNADSIPRSLSFEQYTIQAEVFEVKDTLEGNTFVGNPLIGNDTGIRFYAGVPLATSDGYHIGAISVADTTPRILNDEQKRMLKVLANEVMKYLEFERQKKIHEEERKVVQGGFRSLVENSTDFITVLDAEGLIGYHSPSFYRATGYTEADLVGHHTTEFVHREDKAKIITDFLSVIDNYGSTYTTEFRCRKANGEWMTLEAVGKNALNDESVKGIVINSRDVTERKKAEKEIKEKSQVLNGITNNMPVIIYKVDAEGNFTQAIGAGLEKLGLEGNQLIGGNIYTLFPEVNEFVDMAYRGASDPVVLHGVTGDKPWYFEFYTFADTANEGGLVGFGLDITAQKLYEKEQKNYAANLEKMNKALDQFAYVVSHDLKAPLRAINNLSQWIEEDLGDLLDDKADVKENMSLLRGRVNRMELLINGILEYSRAGRSEIKYEETDVMALVGEVMSALDIPATFKVTTGDLPTIRTSKLRLEQIFSNLLSNAVKYNDKPEGTITIGYVHKENFHEFYVADNGPGIAKEYHEKIFDIFQTLAPKDKSESTGVGLSIVKKIIEELGGSIHVESEPGAGVKFIFTLPARKQSDLNR